MLRNLLSNTYRAYLEYFKDTDVIIPPKGIEYINQKLWVNTWIDDVKLPFPTIVGDISGKKNIKLTQVESENGEVDEWFGRQPYTFAINFVIGSSTVEGHRQQKAIIRQLHEEIHRKVKITNEIINEAGIYEIIITDFSLSQEKRDYQDNVYLLEGSWSCREYVRNYFVDTTTENKDIVNNINNNESYYNSQSQYTLNQMIQE